MKKNIGTIDRIVRVLIGLACFIGAYVVVGVVFKVILLLIGIFAMYEALVGWCAFYMLIGRNTCPIE